MTTANTSVVYDEHTARTDPECATQRARHMAILGAKSVLELCVGPSLASLERAYIAHGMSVTGNDIEERWREYYPRGRWVMGDALEVDPRPYSAVVFAPPLSQGCTGLRCDALRINDVTPGYRDFIRRLVTSGFHGLGVLVLPARSLATRQDRRQMHSLLSCLGDMWQEVVPLTSGPRRIRKYVDVYFSVKS